MVKKSPVLTKSIKKKTQNGVCFFITTFNKKMYFFQNLKDVAGAVADAVRGTGLFRTVEYAAIDSVEQLLEVAKNIPRAPKAIVAIGNGSFDTHSLVREYSLAVVIITDFRADKSGKADELFRAIEAVERLFTPSANGVPASYGGAEFELRSFRALPLDVKTNAVVVELNATDSALTDEGD